MRELRARRYQLGAVLNAGRRNSEGTGGDGKELCRELCLKGTTDDRRVSGRADAAAGGFQELSVSGLRRRGLGEGHALRRLPDLRKGMSTEVYLHREEQGQEAGLRGQ